MFGKETIFMHVAFMHAAKNVIWPPAFPRPKSVLEMMGDVEDTMPPREQWGADEWRRYALFLEEKGKQLASDLVGAKFDLIKARSRLSRRKTRANSVARSVLSREAPKAKLTRGRKPSNGRQQNLGEIMAIKENLGVSDNEAINQWYRNHGKRARSTRENASTRNALSRRRKELLNKSH